MKAKQAIALVLAAALAAGLCACGEDAAIGIIGGADGPTQVIVQEDSPQAQESASSSEGEASAPAGTSSPGPESAASGGMARLVLTPAGEDTGKALVLYAPESWTQNSGHGIDREGEKFVEISASPADDEWCQNLMAQGEERMFGGQDFVYVTEEYTILDQITKEGVPYELQRYFYPQGDYIYLLTFYCDQRGDDKSRRQLRNEIHEVLATLRPADPGWQPDTLTEAEIVAEFRRLDAADAAFYPWLNRDYTQVDVTGLATHEEEVVDYVAHVVTEEGAVPDGSEMPVPVYGTAVYAPANEQTLPGLPWQSVEEINAALLEVYDDLVASCDYAYQLTDPDWAEGPIFRQYEEGLFFNTGFKPFGDTGSMVPGQPDWDYDTLQLVYSLPGRAQVIMEPADYTERVLLQREDGSWVLA